MATDKKKEKGGSISSRIWAKLKEGSTLLVNPFEIGKLVAENRALEKEWDDLVTAPNREFEAFMRKQARKGY